MCAKATSVSKCKHVQRLWGEYEPAKRAANCDMSGKEVKATETILELAASGAEEANDASLFRKLSKPIPRSRAV